MIKNGQRTQTFFQRRHPDGQQTHEKVLNITHHQGSENQKHSERSPPTCQNSYSQKGKNTASVGEDVEKKEPLCTVGGNVNWCNHSGKQYRDSSKR